MDNDDQKAVDALMAAQRKNRKIVPCPECERLQANIEDLNRVIINERTSKIAWRSISANQEIEIERLRKIIESLRKGNEETKI